MRTLILIGVAILAASSSQAEPEKMENYRVGILAPITGDFATYGAKIVRGAEIAKSWLERENIHLSLEVQDGCFGREAATAMNVLRSRQTDYLGAVFCLAAIPVVAPQAVDHGIPAFVSAAATSRVLGAYPWLIAPALSIAEDGRAAARLAKEKVGATRAAILAVDTEFGAEYTTAFADEFKALGGTVVAEELSLPGTSDFQGILTKLSGLKPDVVFVAHLGPMLGNIFRQGKRLGLNVQYIGTYETNDPSVAAVARESLDKVLFYYPRLPQNDEFAQEYEKKFGEKPDFFARISFDSVRLGQRALRECGKNPGCLRSYFSRGTAFTGAAGTYSFTDGGTPRRELELWSCTKGICAAQ